MCVVPPSQYRDACPASRSDSEIVELVKKMGGDEAKIQSALEDWWQSEKREPAVVCGCVCGCFVLLTSIRWVCCQGARIQILNLLPI